MKVKSESEVTQLCPTLRDPLDCSLQGSSVHGIFQARRVLEWGAIAFSVIKNHSEQNACLLIAPKKRYVEIPQEAESDTVWEAAKNYRNP